jgi:hypothetical protein
VHRMPRLQRRPAQVRHAGFVAIRLSTCADSPSAPAAKRQRKLNVGPDGPRSVCLSPHQLDLAYLWHRRQTVRPWRFA